MWVFTNSWMEAGRVFGYGGFDIEKERRILMAFLGGARLKAMLRRAALPVLVAEMTFAAWASQGSKAHWDLDDVVVRELDGVSYRFRCIDDNYSDRMEYHRPAALFLCDSVIPADTGSRYGWEETDDGSYGYVFHPGPLVNFGAAGDYKESAVRRWLLRQEGNLPEAEPVNIGVVYGYTGCTAEGAWGSLGQTTLKGHYLGSQKMTDRLFILSVEEALKYRDRLWRFGGAGEENPESQYGPFSKGYWLRSPAATGQDGDTGMVYLVDLVQGRIRAGSTSPAAEGAVDEDPELSVTGTVGVRPAFTLPQGMW